jgi:general secretion pathway protein L
MSLQEALNSEVDLSTLAASLRRGFRWWLDELAAMTPASWRRQLSASPRLWIEHEDGGWRRWWDDRQLADGDQIRAGAKLGLLAPTAAVLVREVPIPAMTAADAKRMLALDIERLSPLAPELIHFDFEICPPDAAHPDAYAQLAILPREEAARLLEAARLDGHEPAVLAVRLEADGEPHFDFLPQVRAAAGERAGGLAIRAWWIAVALLITLNVGILIGRDVLDVARLNDADEAQRPLVQSVLRLRTRIDGEEARRRAMLARGRRNDPLRMLDALTGGLPKTAWVQHLDWNGQNLHITGFKPQDLDIAEALRATGAFVNPRTSTTEPTVGPTPVRPFDVTADAAQGTAP